MEHDPTNSGSGRIRLENSRYVTTVARQIVKPSVEFAVELFVRTLPLFDVSKGANVNGSFQELVYSAQYPEESAVVGEAAKVFRSVNRFLIALYLPKPSSLHWLI